MKHEPMRERLALDLYDELDEAEKAELEQHLAACADCRRFASELRQGLGGLSREGPTCEFPAGWAERLRSEVEGVPARPALAPAIPLFAAAVGFAACALVVAALGWGPRAADESVEVAADFGRPTPPPAAQTLGLVGQWGSRP